LKKTKKERNRAGGKAGAGGYGFQAQVIARVYAAILRGSAFAAGLVPKTWTSLVPIAVAIETGAGGDDLRVELQDGRAFEIQVKRSAVVGDDLSKAVLQLVSALSADPSLLGAIVCGPTSSGTVRTDLGDALVRMSEGRFDDLPEIARNLRTYLADRHIALESVASRLTVITLDEAIPADVAVLVPVSRADAFWAVLNVDALGQMRLRGRRSRRSLVELARACGFDFEEPGASVAHQLLRYARWLEKKTDAFGIAGSSTRIPIDQALNLQVVFAEEGQDQSSASEERIDGVVERYYAANTQRSDREESHDAHFVFDFNSRVVLIGGPGAGKSLLLRRIAHRLARRGPCVLHVSLRDLTRQKEAGQTYSQALEQLAFDGFTCTNEERERLMRNVDCIIADGLDECAGRTAEVTSWLRDWLSGQPQVCALVSTRAIGFDAQQFSPDDWHIGTIEPLDPRLLDQHVDRLVKAILPAGGGIGTVSISKSGTRAESRWSSPLIIALAASLVARGVDLPDHESDLLRAFVACYGAQPPTGRILAWYSGSPEIRARILEAVAATLRTKPSMSGQELVDHVAKVMAAEIGTTQLAATVHVRDALKHWEDHALLEVLHEGGNSYYAFSHMQICESLAADYWARTSDGDVAGFRAWVASTLLVPQQEEVLRSLACTYALPPLIDALHSLEPVPQGIAVRIAELVIYSGAERANSLDAQRREAIEAGILSAYDASTNARERCAEAWLRLPWPQIRDPFAHGVTLTPSPDRADFLNTMALKLRLGATSPTDEELSALFSVSSFGSPVTTTSSTLVLGDHGPLWSLYNRRRRAAFDRLSPSSAPDVLTAAQRLLERSNFSVKTGFALFKSAQRLGLDVSSQLNRWLANPAFFGESGKREHAQELWLLGVLEEIVADDVKANATSISAPWTLEFRDIGAIVSVLSTGKLYVNEYLDLSKPPDSAGVRAVLRGIAVVLKIDGRQLLAEAHALRPQLSPDADGLLISRVPKVAVLALDRRGEHRANPGFSVPDIVDALFHKSRAIADPAVNLIVANQIGAEMAPLVEARWQGASEATLCRMAFLADRIWPTTWAKQLLTAIAGKPRAGLHYLVLSLVHAGHGSNRPLSERVLELIRLVEPREASSLAQLLARFDTSLVDEARLRQVFDYWIEHQRPVQNGEWSYTSPLVPIAQLMVTRGWLTPLDEQRLAGVDRSEVQTLCARVVDTSQSSRAVIGRFRPNG